MKVYFVQFDIETGLPVWQSVLGGEPVMVSTREATGWDDTKGRLYFGVMKGANWAVVDGRKGRYHKTEREAWVTAQQGTHEAIAQAHKHLQFLEDTQAYVDEMLRHLEQSK